MKSNEEDLMYACNNYFESLNFLLFTKLEIKNHELYGLDNIKYDEELIRKREFAEKRFSHSFKRLKEAIERVEKNCG